MPAQNGLEVLKSLREKDWATSVIFISAFADDAVRAKAKRMGAAAVLSKPFSISDFVCVVRSVAPPR
jgi:DNA-binding NarL/FixJ family response regulator